VAVRIRLKRLGRRHRPFYRICAMESRVPRDGKVLEELGTYDPMISDIDARVVMNNERVSHWLSVGALPTGKVAVLIRKYGPNGTRCEENQQAREKAMMAKPVPPTPTPVVAAAPAAEEPAAKAESGDAASEPEAAETAPAEPETAETSDQSAKEEQEPKSETPEAEAGG